MVLGRVMHPVGSRLPSTGGNHLMREITGLISRAALVEKAAQEVRKGWLSYKIMDRGLVKA